MCPSSFFIPTILENFCLEIVEYKPSYIEYSPINQSCFPDTWNVIEHISLTKQLQFFTNWDLSWHFTEKQLLSTKLDLHVLIKYWVYDFFCHLCIVEDLERNDGRDKPYFMSKELMKLLNAHNVKTGEDRTDGNANTRGVEETENLW